MNLDLGDAMKRVCQSVVMVRALVFANLALTAVIAYASVDLCSESLREGVSDLPFLFQGIVHKRPWLLFAFLQVPVLALSISLFGVLFAARWGHTGVFIFAPI